MDVLDVDLQLPPSFGTASSIRYKCPFKAGIANHLNMILQFTRIRLLILFYIALINLTKPVQSIPFM